ncbi:MAG: ABC transporter permease [Bacteroidota bacterium]
MQNLKLAWRHLRQNKLFTLINTAGLVIGLAGVLVIMLFLQQELTYDQLHGKLDRIFVLRESQEYTQSVTPALPKLLEDYPEVVAGTRLVTWYDTWLEYEGKSAHSVLSHVDGTFFEVFDFPLRYGDPAKALSDPHQIVLGAEESESLFGERNPVGESVLIDTTVYQVTGVLEPLPVQSSLQFNSLVSLETILAGAEFREVANWYNSFQETFVVLEDIAQKEPLEAKLPYFVDRYFDEASKDRELFLSPFAEYHAELSGNSPLLVGVGIVAFFLLLVVALNFINLTLAKAMGRVSEVSIRKVLGAARLSILRQFQLEALLLTIISLALGLFLIHFSLPFINQSLGSQLSLDEANSATFFLIGVGMVLALTLSAGLYPAWQLFKKADLSGLKGKTTTAKGNGFRSSLVVAQFAITLVLLVSSIAVARQIHFMKAADLGLASSNVLIGDLELDFKDPDQSWKRVVPILDQLEQNSAVEAYTLSYDFPGDYSENYNYFLKESATDGARLRQTNIGSDYFQTFDIPLLEGRGFSADRQTDTDGKVILNESARKVLGIPAGSADGALIKSKTDSRFEVVGIVEDYHYQSLEAPVEPVIHFFVGPKKELEDGYLSVRVQSGREAEVMAFLSDAVGQVPSRRQLSLEFLDEHFAGLYGTAESTLLLLRFFTVVVIILACAGLFALSAMHIQARTKEIGIRKVLGANLTQLLGLLSRRYFWMIGLGCLLAVPIAWWLVNTWLSNFAYRINLDMVLFLQGGGLLLLIALTTISWHLLKAAFTNPVDSLRDE